MKLLLVNPPQIFTTFQVAAGLVPPLGLTYLASFAMKQGIDVELLDTLGEAPETVNPFQRQDIFLRGLSIDDAVARVPDDTGLIGISNLFSFAFPAVQELVAALKRARPDVPVVLGGAHPTHLCDYTLENTEADYVILGEGEIPLVKLWDHVQGGAPLAEVPSLAHLDDAGRVVRTAAFPRLGNIDSVNVPFPARHLLPMENYIDAQEAHGAAGGRWTTILSSRGCPYGCTFCDSRRTKFVARSAQDVVDEIEHCRREYGIAEFHFEDDNMTLLRDRIIEICDEIIRRGLQIRWQTPNGIRASVTDEEMLLKMKASGCTHVTLAPESGSMRVHAEIVQKGKDFSLEQLLEVARAAHRLGLKCAAYFILGLPGERAEDVEMTIDYAAKLSRAGVDEAVFGLFTPLPGTPLWDQVVAEYGRPDFLDLLVIGDLNKAVSWTKSLTAEDLSAFRRRAYLTFQLNRMVFHPFKFFRTLFNVLRGLAETKTENKLRTFIRRARGAAGKKPGRREGYTPYDGERTVSVLLKTTPVYGFSGALYKALLLLLGGFSRVPVRRSAAREPAQTVVSGTPLAPTAMKNGVRVHSKETRERPAGGAVRRPADREPKGAETA